MEPLNEDEERETVRDSAASWLWLILLTLLIMYVVLAIVGFVVDLLPSITGLRCGW